jgi:hypothetical protein
MTLHTVDLFEAFFCEKKEKTMALIDSEVSDTVVDMYIRGFFQSLSEKILSLVPEVFARTQPPSMMFPQKAMTSMGQGLNNPQKPAANLKLRVPAHILEQEINTPFSRKKDSVESTAIIKHSRVGEIAADYRVDHNRTFVKEPERFPVSRKSVGVHSESHRRKGIA